MVHRSLWLAAAAIFLLLPIPSGAAVAGGDLRECQAQARGHCGDAFALQPAKTEDLVCGHGQPWPQRQNRLADGLALALALVQQRWVQLL